MKIISTQAPLARSQPVSLEMKDIDAPPQPGSPGSVISNMYSFIEYLVGRGAYDLSAYVTLMYYRRCAPVFDAVDRIGDEVAGMRLTIYDHIEDRYVDDHPILTLLSKPNPKDSGWDFLKTIATYFLVTGNNYVGVTGGMNRPPLELWNLIPTRVTIVQSPLDGWAGEYLYHSTTGTQTFKRQEVKGNWNYVQDDMRQLIHIKTFNPGDGIDLLYGMSKLTPIYYEIEQWLNASIHNLALLRNGAAPSGVLVTDQNLTDDQYQRLMKEMQTYYMGAKNAGRPMITEGGLKYQSMGMTNKDLDFEKLKIHIQDMLYNVLRIPLPLVSRAQMTMTNMDGAKFIFYDNAVLPIFNRIMDGLGEGLFPRYKMDPQRYQLTFMQEDIPSLEARKMTNTKDLKSLEVLTDNEIRALIGYGQLSDGNTIYRPNNLVPMGTDLDTSDEGITDAEAQGLNREPPPDEDEGGGGEAEPGKKFMEFVRLMRSKKRADGKRAFTDDQIMHYARIYGIIHTLSRVELPSE